MKIAEILNYLRGRFPLELASDFDKERVGLVMGDEDLQLSNVLLSLDVNIDVIHEAIDNNANLIVCHHNPFFHGLRNIFFNSIEGKMIETLIKHKISIFVMHTNLDVGSGGVNDQLARMLEIQDFYNRPNKDEFMKYGKIKPILLRELSEKIKDRFNINGVRVVGNLDKVITQIGVIGGSGGREDDVRVALNLGLDCYITGEIKLSAAQLASSNGLSLIEVNHGVEKFVFYNLKDDLIDDLKLTNKVLVSKHNTDPLTFL